MGTPATGHLDADCFYVNAERVRDRFLLGKPVGVLGNQGACVIARSYEMKAAGVAVATPIWEATRLCPSGIYLKRDFRWYEVLSRRMLDAVREVSPAVEYYSIDEFFFRVVPLRGQSLQETAEAIRDRVLRAVGVPVTVGIARTRTLAKLVSDTAKPFGARALTDPEAERALLTDLPVTEITGIARRRAARLAAHDIHTCLDFVRADPRLVQMLLTVEGRRLWHELNGEAVVPLRTERPPHKLLSRGGSIGAATADPARVFAWLVRNLERLVEALEYHRVCAGRLLVSVVHKDGTGASARAPLGSPTDRFDLLLEAARPALARVWDVGRPLHRMHLVASGLCRPGFVQRGLFDPPDDAARAVAQTKEAVNAAVGRFALRSGATLPLADVYRDEAQNYDICDIQGKMCF
jgi:nucleotidyltransferase/DNA polymerase involved in DNA repair